MTKNSALLEPLSIVIYKLSEACGSLHLASFGFLLRRYQDNPNAVREALSNPLIVKRGGQERESMFKLGLEGETLSLGSLSYRHRKSES